MLVRAARHYEGAGQVLLRQAVMSAQEFVSIGQGEMPPIGEWQEVECPARLDLSGKATLIHTYRLNLRVTLHLRASAYSKSDTSHKHDMMHSMNSNYIFVFIFFLIYIFF